MASTSRINLAGQVWYGKRLQCQLARRFRLPDEKRIGAAPGLAADADVDSDFEITCITAQSGLPEWRGAWRRLLADSLSPEKIYQTPEFFRFLVDTRTAGADQFELFLITQRGQDKVVGIVPVRIVTIALEFGVVAWQARVVRILGSVPLMPAAAALLHQLCAHLLRTFPACAAVSMPAFPSEMQAPLYGDRRHRALLLHGWRACHTIALPDDWPAYLGQLSASKRHKLERQYRLLEQASGPLQLERVDRSVAVKALVEGVRALAPHGDPARDYRVLAANRLLLSYVLRSDDEVIAVIVGSRYGDTWHVQQILSAPAWRHLAPGAVVLHAALQDVITHFALTSADLGFARPGHQFGATHTLHTRAHVLIARRGGWRTSLLGAFVRFDGARAACASRIKPFMRRLLRR
ncbi:GNAT family N-acetyltransferase [Massilia sp. S19_KUP03_FR1]|uniref:GNAT family N-acetyltransferase n=1 Tax=Massilia sp. S19_KUP03_FR1 TaxID=3025503 RepID=UPI002FCD83FA